MAIGGRFDPYREIEGVFETALPSALAFMPAGKNLQLATWSAQVPKQVNPINTAQLPG